MSASTVRTRAPGPPAHYGIRNLLRITTGVYFKGNVWRPVPLAGAGIDLTIDAPRGVSLKAVTFGGDIDASGFRSGARLESQHGEIRAADLEGRVDTRTAQGRQTLQGIHGSVEASGIDGDVELESIEGETLDATVYHGQITARGLRTPVVRLRTTHGAVIFLGALLPGGRYELSSLSGDLKVQLCPSPFRLVARAGGTISAGAFTLTSARSSRGLLEGEWRGGGPSLELASAQGSVVLAQAECK